MRLRGSVWTGPALKGREASDCKNNASHSHSHSKTRVKVVVLNSLSNSSYIFSIKIITEFYMSSGVLSYITFVLNTEKFLLRTNVGVFLSFFACLFS